GHRCARGSIGWAWRSALRAWQGRVSAAILQEEVRGAGASFLFFLFFPPIFLLPSPVSFSLPVSCRCLSEPLLGRGGGRAGCEEISGLGSSAPSFPFSSLSFSFPFPSLFPFPFPSFFLSSFLFSPLFFSLFQAYPGLSARGEQRLPWPMCSVTEQDWSPTCQAFILYLKELGLPKLFPLQDPLVQMSLMWLLHLQIYVRKSKLIP
ncbi:hypothetical protein Nmel_009485, partial [Mimus melanotis]